MRVRWENGVFRPVNRRVSETVRELQDGIMGPQFPEVRHNRKPFDCCKHLVSSDRLIRFRFMLAILSGILWR